MTASLARSGEVVLAVDPGREKCGAAVVTPQRVLARGVIPLRRLVEVAAQWAGEFGVNRLALGDRTGRDEVRTLLNTALPDLPIVLIDEAGTTQAARAAYFSDHPPRGWRRLVPQTMLVPPEPYDDYVAVQLAERALHKPSQRFPG